MADAREFEGEGTLVLEQRFAIVPKWIIDTEISDCAFRLYAVLPRYGQTSGQRMPGPALLARRLHKASKDTVDRALKELVALGAVEVERRQSGLQNLTNRYHVRNTPPGSPTGTVTAPGRTAAATPTRRAAGAPVPDRTLAATPGRTCAATPDRPGAATGGRTGAAPVAAPMRPDPDVLTEREPPHPSGRGRRRCST